MNIRKSGALLLLASVATLSSTGQTRDSAASHVAAAKAAAGSEHMGLFNTICAAPTDARPASAADPARWHAAPAKVFDNLYYVGEAEYSAWAVNTSEGIIVFDAIFARSVEDEIVSGLKRLGLDPARIKYVVISHAHEDHAGGAKYLQDHFGAHVLMSAADWDLLAHSPGTWSKPKRDMVVSDGQKLTLGDTSITLYLTPGHTAGTVSALIPVKDHGAPHLAATWGGTAFNWLRSPDQYITPEKTSRFWFETYIRSAERYRDIVTQAGADVLLSNHTIYDRTKEKVPALANRKPGEPNPYVIGTDSVRRYLTVADECAKANMLRTQ